MLPDISSRPSKLTRRSLQCNSNQPSFGLLLISPPTLSHDRYSGVEGKGEGDVGEHYNLDSEKS